MYPACTNSARERLCLSTMSPESLPRVAVRLLPLAALLALMAGLRTGCWRDGGTPVEFAAAEPVTEERSPAVERGADVTSAPEPQVAIIPALEARVHLLASLISAESYCDDSTDMRRVATVVANRVDAPDFPDTYRGVIYARRQFPSTRRAGFGTDALMCDGAEAIAREVISGRRFLPPEVHYFYNPANVTASPEWLARLRRGTVVEGRRHHFVRGRTAVSYPGQQSR